MYFLFVVVVVQNEYTEFAFTAATEIVSDEWRAYRGLSEFGYSHKTVNHSKNFVDPEGRKHTQLIECLWSVARATIMRRGRGTCKGNLPGYLGEQWFRSIHQKIHQSFLLKF